MRPKKFTKKKNDKQDYQKNNFFKKKKVLADLLLKVLNGLITKMFSY